MLAVVGLTLKRLNFSCRFAFQLKSRFLAAQNQIEELRSRLTQTETQVPAPLPEPHRFTGPPGGGRFHGNRLKQPVVLFSEHGSEHREPAAEEEHLGAPEDRPAGSAPEGPGDPAAEPEVRSWTSRLEI